jgi:hypothetical protein
MCEIQNETGKQPANKTNKGDLIMSYLKGATHFLKFYYLRPDKLDEFRKFFNEGERDDCGNILIIGGKPAEGVRKWLIDKGVNNLVAWLVKYPPVNAQSGVEAQPEKVILCAVSLMNTDWYEIPGLKEYLREAYPPEIEWQPDFCISIKIGIIKAVIKAFKDSASHLTRVLGNPIKVLASRLNR